MVKGRLIAAGGKACEGCGWRQVEGGLVKVKGVRAGRRCDQKDKEGQDGTQSRLRHEWGWASLLHFDDVKFK